MRLALVGLPGCGKSTLGRQLGRRLGLPFFDADVEIESRIGMSIRQYFELEGEPAFREIETRTIEDLCQRDKFVLATGGGAVLKAQNRDVLRRCCTVVYLRAHPDDLWRRLKHDTKRPLLQVQDGLARLQKLAREREPFYCEVADFIIETGHPSPKTILNMITMQVELAQVAGTGQFSSTAVGEEPGLQG